MKYLVRQDQLPEGRKYNSPAYGISRGRPPKVPRKPSRLNRLFGGILLEQPVGNHVPLHKQVLKRIKRLGMGYCPIAVAAGITKSHFKDFLLGRRTYTTDVFDRVMRVITHYETLADIECSFLMRKHGISYKPNKVGRALAKAGVLEKARKMYRRIDKAAAKKAA